MDSSQQRKFSVLMFPWLAHGHISPYLELAKKLTNRNFHIYFCSTPVNLRSIKPKLSEKYSRCIELVQLHLPYEDLPELPPHYHTTNGLPPYLMSTLKTAFDMASPNFSDILKTLNPDLLIYDFLQPWAPSLALLQNIPAIEFFTTSAAMMSVCTHHGEKPGVKFPFPSIYYETSKIKMLLESSSNGISDGDRAKQCSDRSCKILLVKSSREIEAKYIDYLSDLIGKKIVPVGSLVQDLIEQEVDSEETKIMKWLNTRERSSVVYVSFGSEYFLSKEEIEEIAHGLELSKAKILKHSSAGGFVSHCGWSSVLESIKFGVPIVAMPMHLDQPINARIVEDVGVGVEVKRMGGGGNENGRLKREEIAKVIRDVVVEENGLGLKRKAMELRDNMKKREDEEIDGVVEQLIQLCMRKE
ncbi:hypothetical protein GBA52_008172 [Prunus armeniaca]|nr:hypothetical protein GBA52_008172 [Prunus armeniaca]